MSEPVDLTNCDREPIHVPGSIQSHGWLITTDRRGRTIRRHSANLGTLFGGPGADWAGRAFEDLVGAAAVHDLRNALLLGADPKRPALLTDLPLGPDGARCDVAAHLQGGEAIFEIEPAAPRERLAPAQTTRALIGRIAAIAAFDHLIGTTAQLVQATLGYDRAMIYRFEADGSGRIIGESRRGDLEPFLGRYFPASDIPRQARALYLANTLRYIADVRDAFVPVLPRLDEQGRPLDLSFAHLRSVSPIHCEYLRNMGVAASMSISVIVEGALWGLIVCHHGTPRRLTMEERVSAEMFGDFFSLHLQAMLQRHAAAAAERARASLQRLIVEASRDTAAENVLAPHLGRFAALIDSDGLGLWHDGQWSAFGTTVDESLVPALLAHIEARAGGEIWASDALAAEFPLPEGLAHYVAGVLAIPVSQTRGDYLVYFRKEVVRTIDWGGKPEKVYETGPLGERLTPRKSFEIWRETVQGRSYPWGEEERALARHIRVAVVEIILRHNELLADEREKAALRQRILNEELNHRVKNILALIRSLVSQSPAQGQSLAEYMAALQGRIGSLAGAHDQVVRSAEGGCLASLLRAELTPYERAAGRIRLEGPKVRLDARAYSVIALVVHELATNATKYGALSVAAGRLDLRWSLTAQGDCRLCWRESGGPPVPPRRSRGFGSGLIENSVPFDLGGEAAIDFAPEGLSAHFLVPARHLVPAEAPAAPPAPPQAAAPILLPETPAALSHVLVVEDQLLIALDLAHSLSARGIGVRGPHATVEAALRDLEAAAPSAAVLDLNLGDQTSIAVAEELRRRGIPFVFATGYGDSLMIPEAFQAVPVVRKPYDWKAIVAQLGESMRRG